MSGFPRDRLLRNRLLRPTFSAFCRVLCVCALVVLSGTALRAAVEPSRWIVQERLGVDGSAYAELSALVAWSKGSVWSESFVWSEGLVWNEGFVWSDSPAWSEGFVWSESPAWSETVDWDQAHAELGTWLDAR